MRFGTKQRKKSTFSGSEITLITLVGMIAGGILVFSCIVIWLVSAL